MIPLPARTKPTSSKSNPFFPDLQSPTLIDHDTHSFIAVGSLGYPLRIDMHMYTYAFSSATLTKVTKNVLAVSVVVSSVDISQLDDSTLGAMVEYCYGSVTADKQQAILDKILAVKNKVHPA